MVKINSEFFDKIRFNCAENFLYWRAKSIDKVLNEDKNAVSVLGLYPVDNYVRKVVNSVDDIYYNHQDKDNCAKLYRILYTTRELIEKTIEHINNDETAKTVFADDKRIDTMRRNFPVYLKYISSFRHMH